MALADHKLESSATGNAVERLRRSLDKRDREWLDEHLTTKDDRGHYAFSASAIAGALAEEVPLLAVSESTIRAWRRANP